MMVPTTVRAATAWAFGLMFMGVSLWAFVAELDYGVHADGKIVNRYPSIPIQHNATARVAKVQVTEGQQVRAGDVLLALDDADTVAEAGHAVAQYLTLRLQMDALMAEQRGDGRLPRPVANLAALSSNVVSRAHAEASQALLQRLTAHRGQLDQFEMEIRTAETQRHGLKQEASRLAEQGSIVERQLQAMQPLVDERLVSRSAADELRLRLAELRRSEIAVQSEQARLISTVEQVQGKRLIYLAEREKEMRVRLSELEPQTQSAKQLLDAVGSRLQSLVIRAATDGQVINLKVKASGTVIEPGKVLMELVPERRKYFVEALISTAEIENVHAHMPAEVTFVTLPAKATPYVGGHLVAVASDSTINEKTGEAFYIATVDFDEDVTKALAVEPTLGMPVQVLLKGGRRSVMSYIVEPFRSLMRKAMKET